jgi:hypothetical protein
MTTSKLHGIFIESTQMVRAILLAILEFRIISYPLAQIIKPRASTHEPSNMTCVMAARLAVSRALSRETAKRAAMTQKSMNRHCNNAGGRDTLV